MNDFIKADIENRLKIKIDDCEIHYFTEGATDSTVFSIHNKYLIKTFKETEFDIQVEFLNKYKNKYFQKIIYMNKDLLYICFEFVEGTKFKIDDINIEQVLNDVYNICSHYELVDYDGYGYLDGELNKSWKDFLFEEIIYSKSEITNVDISKIFNALDVIQKYKCDKYLIHGDFGTHNFLINNGEIRVIDPMGVIGDYLYDFYFALLSNKDLFMNISLERILSYFDKEMEYKKALLYIVIYIRMSRAHKYDINSYANYLELFNNFSEEVLS